MITIDMLFFFDPISGGSTPVLDKDFVFDDGVTQMLLDDDVTNLVTDGDA